MSSAWSHPWPQHRRGMASAPHAQPLGDIAPGSCLAASAWWSWWSWRSRPWGSFPDSWPDRWHSLGCHSAHKAPCPPARASQLQACLSHTEVGGRGVLSSPPSPQRPALQQGVSTFRPRAPIIPMCVRAAGCWEGPTCHPDCHQGLWVASRNTAAPAESSSEV